LQILLDNSKSAGKCFSSSVAVPAPPSPLGKALKEFDKSKFELSEQKLRFSYIKFTYTSFLVFTN